MKSYFSRYVDGLPALGLLLLRVFSGLALMVHGWPKIQAPFAWMGPTSHVPGFLQAVAALGEYGGGAALAVGFLTPLAALGVLCVMFGAWSLVLRGEPWINPQGRSFELASLYAIIAFTLLFTGPGRFSIDALLFGRGRKR